MSPEEKKAARAARRLARKQGRTNPHRGSAEFLACYPKNYASWAGNPAGIKPDYSRCCGSVHRNYRSYQCSKPNGHGPAGAHCATHNPDVVAARRQASDDKYRRERDQNKRTHLLGAHGKSLADALILIEEGHNDPRALAAEVLKPIREHLHLWVEQGDPKESTKR